MAAQTTSILTGTIPQTFRCVNTTGSAIPGGSPVYVSGYDTTVNSSGRFAVTLADADAVYRNAQYIVMDTIANNAEGVMYEDAVSNGVNTGGATIGDPVYLSTTAGSWTLSAPTGAGSAQVIGTVLTVSTTTGTIYWRFRGSFPGLIGTNQLGPTTITGTQTVSSSSASALAVGLNGSTNPAFNVDASVALQAAGLNVAGAVAAGTVAVAVISSGAAASLTVDAKGTGTILIGGTSTGNITLGTTGHTILLNNGTGAVTFAAGGVTMTAGNLLLSSGTATVTSASANALAVGRQGATSPALNVDASAATSVTGFNIAAAAAGAGLALSLVGGNAAENLTLDAKGAGTMTLQGTATGAITLGRATGVTGAVTVTSAGAAALAVGRLGGTTPALNVDASAGTSVTGFNIAAAAAGAGLALSLIGGNAAENMTLDAKGAGTLTLQGTATGNISLARTTQVTGQYQAGAVSARATTTGVSMIEFKVGTAPVGAATTTSGVYASATAMRKIIADGTDSLVG